MNQIKIGVHVPLAAAVAMGRSEYGYTSVTLTDGDIATLSTEARALLDTFDASGSREERRRGLVGVRQGNWTCEIDVTSADPATVLAEIEAIATTHREKVAADLAASEERIAVALSRPHEDWIGHETTNATAYLIGTTWYYRPRVEVAPRGCYLTEPERRDPRIVEHAARIAAVALPELLATHDAAVAAHLATNARENAKAEANAKTWRNATRDYVIRWVPEYAQAARDGSDVRRLAVETSVAACTEMLNSHDLNTVEGYGDVEAHPRPHQRAYDALTMVQTWMDLARREEIAAAGEGLVDGYAARIVRIDTCAESRCTAGKRTAIEVSLHYVNGTTEGAYVYADGELPHVHDDGDSDD